MKPKTYHIYCHSSFYGFPFTLLLRKLNSLGECKQSTDWKSADDTREYPPHASPMPFLNHLASPEFKSAWEEKQISARTKGSRKVVFQSFWSFFWGAKSWKILFTRSNLMGAKKGASFFVADVREREERLKGRRLLTKLGHADTKVIVDHTTIQFRSQLWFQDSLSCRQNLISAAQSLLKTLVQNSIFAKM